MMIHPSGRKSFFSIRVNLRWGSEFQAAIPSYSFLMKICSTHLGDQMLGIPHPSSWETGHLLAKK
jgi:hypothetical protein